MNGPAGTANARPDVVHSLLDGAIDYAGLFPPAALAMDPAVENYLMYRNEAEARLLGRFVAPASRLPELATASDARDARGIRVSAVLGANLAGDVESVHEFNARLARQSIAVDTVEAKADRPAIVYELAARTTAALEAFVELPLGSELELLVAAAREVGVCAKVRTGGLTNDAFPASRDVVRFMCACLDAGVPFKATAGLHHAVTGTYPLTYEPESPRGRMFGFLNVPLASAFLRAGISDDDAVRLLDESDRSAFAFSPDGASWRGRRVDSRTIVESHWNAFRAIGSCSFAEPVDELRSMALLP